MRGFEAVPAGGPQAVRVVEADARLRSIQMLRAVAIAMVVIYHGLAVLPHPDWARRAIPPSALYIGYAGVDLFFVISGFIVMHVTERPITPVRFLRNRFLRILPFYWAATLLVLVLSGLLPGQVPMRGGDLAGELVRSLLLVPEPWRPLLGVGWTLQHEVIFYLVVTLLLWLGARRHIFAVAMLMLAAGVAAHVVAPGSAPWDYKIFSLYWFEFALGILAWQVGQVAIPTRQAAGMVVAGVAGMMLTGWLATPLLPADGEVPAVAAGAFGVVRVAGFGVASFLLLVGARALEPLIDPRRAIDRAVEQVGGASFIIYLGHNFVLQAVAALARRLHLGWSGSAVALAIAIPVVIVGGCWIHRMVERPINRGLRRWADGSRRPAAPPLLPLAAVQG